MIVYREFSSLIEDLGFSAKTLYSVSNHIEKHYRTVLIPKANGGMRKLSVPDELLKSIQRKINTILLPLEPISPYAAAYRPNGSTRRNAAPHTGKPMLLKLDVKDFFGNILYPTVKDRAFPAERYSEQNRVLLTMLCIFEDALPQGAPTSPTISNIVMREFDNAVGAWCVERGIAYTRYCDDMSFSGTFDPLEVTALVQNELRKLGLFLNGKKTVLAKQGQRQIVTGIVVNKKRSIPSEYKKKLRQELYYCKKFGMREHLSRIGSGENEESYRKQLLGRLNYVLSVEPQNQQMREYINWLMKK